jgi:hypothetical protein
VLSAVLDRVEQVGEIAGGVGSADLRHDLRLSDPPGHAPWPQPKRHRTPGSGREEAAQVLAIRLEGAPAVARQERHGSKLGLIELGTVERRLHRRGVESDRGHGCISSSC